MFNDFRIAEHLKKVTKLMRFYCHGNSMFDTNKAINELRKISDKLAVNPPDEFESALNPIQL